MLIAAAIGRLLLHASRAIRKDIRGEDCGGPNADRNVGDDTGAFQSKAAIR